MKNVVDSSGWLEYFTDGTNAEAFAVPLRDTSSLIVPVISILEVFKVILRERDENEALQVVAVMEKGRVVELTSKLAMVAAKLSLQHRLPMADSIILATARSYGALVWTQDEDFHGLPGVRYLAKKK